MTQFWKAKLGLGLFGLILIFPLNAQANDWCPGKVSMNVALDFWIRVYSKSEMGMQNLDPWYTYFPGGGGMMESPHCNAYPTWPSSFPPPQSQPAQNKTPAFGYNRGYPGNPPGQATGQTAGNGQAPVFQPASYYPTSVPSYWFAR